MSAASQRTLRGGFDNARRSFRAWRWARPFWAGLLTLLAGLPIMYFPYANITMGQLTIRMATTAGSGSLIIGVLLVVLGLTMWFQPMVRVFSGVAAILLCLVSLVVSNFGGFVIGFLLGLIGGGLAIAWAPAPAAGENTGGGSGADGRQPGENAEPAEGGSQTGGYDTGGYDADRYDAGAYDTGTYGTGGYRAGGYDGPQAAVPAGSDDDMTNGRHSAG